MGQVPRSAGHTLFRGSPYHPATEFLVSPPHTDIVGWHLGIRLEGYDSIPKPGKREEGLRVILIPIQPCNVRLLKDAAAIYVGVTGTDIHSGNSNYIFSSGVVLPNSQGTILSYYMMLAESASDQCASEKRLTERLAKELVPASLKALNIPRSTDPRCPYSYCASLDRLDQKTLSLSDEVKAALDKLKK